MVADLQGQGRTADADRPFSHATMADDVAALIRHLGAGTADVLGYSLGGEVALRTAIGHPSLVGRLVLVSVTFRRDGSFPEVVQAFDGFTADAAGFLEQGPIYEAYRRLAPRPEDWGTLIAKTADLLHEDFDWTAELAALTARTMLVYADSDSVRPEHVTEFHNALGGGLRDAMWDGSLQPETRLAVVPGRTHYDIIGSPLLAPAVASFLDA